MDKISINDLLGVKIKKIYSGSELIFFYELSKYSKELLNKEIDFGEITVIKELRNSDFCQYLYNKGFDINFDLTSDDMVIYQR